MIISESSVILQSSHYKVSAEKETESFRAWIDGQDAAAATDNKPVDRASFERIVDKVKLSAESLSMAHGQINSGKARTSSMPDDVALMKKLKECAKGQCKNGKTETDTDLQDDVIVGDSQLNLMKQLVEVLSGKKVHIVNPSTFSENADLSSGDAPAATATDSQNTASNRTSQGPAREGWGVTYDYSKTTVEQEQTQFAAEGAVRTQDGRQINFSSWLKMEREQVEVSSFQLRAGDAQLVDPLTLNFNGGAAQLTDEKIDFDLNSDGIDETIPFVTADSGFLALDKNGDGIVNNGSELFGPTTGNGFAELAGYDDDSNGWIDEADAVYDNLRIWRGGAGTAGTALTDLRSSNVGAIYLGSAVTPFENRSADGSLLGQTTATGVFLREDGQVGTVQQIDLVS